MATFRYTIAVLGTLGLTILMLILMSEFT